MTAKPRTEHRHPPGLWRDRRRGRAHDKNKEMRSSAQPAPGWLSPAEYPFPSKFFSTPYGEMHYVDEGAGDVIPFLHGNPTWSFEHRHLIAHLRRRFRCIALDYIGFGLSDKPYAVSYLPRFHAENLARFIDALGLTQITLVVHDWGGPIGMSYAVNHTDNVKRIIAYNSWFWSVNGIRSFERFSGFMGGPIGRFLCRNLNVFPRLLIPLAVGDKTKLLRSAHEHYIKPFPTPRSRKGHLGVLGRDHRPERVARDAVGKARGA